MIYNVPYLKYVLIESRDEVEEGEQTDDEPETQDDNVKKRADYEALLKKFPKWTHPLEFGVKTMPITNLMNVDPDEGAARIFDNLVLIYILGFMDQYTSRSVCMRTRKNTTRR